jgi:hypothetical protein
MKIKSKTTAYVISSIAIFLVSSIWLRIIEEERIGVYLGVLLITIFSSGYIINPKIKYRFIIDMAIIIFFLLIMRLEIVYFLTS